MISRLVKIAVACLALSGCWLSQQDLLSGQTLSDSGFEGEFVYPFNELNPARRVSVSRAGSGVLTMIRHKAVNYEAQTSRLKTLELGQGYFLISEEMDYAGYKVGYSIVRRNLDGALVQYRAPCEDWMASIVGVTRDAQHRDICAFRSFSALEAVALSSIRRGTLLPQAVYSPVSR